MSITIDEAIEVNTEVAEMRGKRSTAEKREALWLGIEALKRYQDFRSHPEMIRWEPLPGETKD